MSPASHRALSETEGTLQDYLPSVTHYVLREAKEWGAQRRVGGREIGMVQDVGAGSSERDCELTWQRAFGPGAALLLWPEAKSAGEKQLRGD